MTPDIERLPQQVMAHRIAFARATARHAFLMYKLELEEYALDAANDIPVVSAGQLDLLLEEAMADRVWREFWEGDK